MNRPRGEPSLCQAPAGEAATVIPRGSARTAGIPAGDAASNSCRDPRRAAIPQVACRRSEFRPADRHPSAATTAWALAAQRER